MSKFDRKLLKIIKRLEAEACYLDKLSSQSSNETKAQQIGISEGILLATSALRNQFSYSRHISIEEEYGVVA